MASLETALNKLKDAWDTFTMGLLNEDILKGVVELLTEILNAINGILEPLDNAGIGFLGFGARIAMIIGGLMLLDKVTHLFFVSMKNGNSILISATAALRGYALAEGGAKISTDANTLAKAKAITTTYLSILANAKARVSVKNLDATERRYLAILTAE
jgi:hypothetical protein